LRVLMSGASLPHFPDASRKLIPLFGSIEAARRPA
jgi:hypothetical protein